MQVVEAGRPPLLRLLLLLLRLHFLAADAVEMLLRLRVEATNLLEACVEGTG